MECGAGGVGNVDFRSPIAEFDFATSAPTAVATRVRAPSRARGHVVRPLERRDIPAICDLFLKTFREGTAKRKDDLATALHEIYLGAPAYRPDAGSLVNCDHRGRVNGFLGIINIGMTVGQRPIRAGVVSAFMAEGADTDPAIGLRLSRALSSRSCDLVFSDTANRTSLDMARAMRFDVMPMQSLDWIKMLRPAGTGAHLLGLKFPKLREWVRPLAGAMDACLPDTAASGVDARTIEGLVDRPMALADFVAEAPAWLSRFTLRPTWDAAELDWLMKEAGLRTRGGPLHIREVRDRRDRRIGLYLLYAGPGSVAYALQVLAAPARADAVLGALVAQAKRIGAVAVGGSASPDIVEGLLRQPGVIYRGGRSCVVRTTDPEVARALGNGDAMLGGLAGETWTRIYADEFG